MKTAILATIAVLAGSAAAQINLDGLPTCAKGCLDLKGLASSGCSNLDINCICHNSDFVDGLACCVSQQCDLAGQKDTITFANGICKQANVVLPTSASCASGFTATATGASAGSATASTSGTASAASTAASGSSSSTGISTTTSASGSATAASSASTPSATSTGGAAALAQGVGAAGGLVAALVALL